MHHDNNQTDQQTAVEANLEMEEKAKQAKEVLGRRYSCPHLWQQAQEETQIMSRLLFGETKQQQPSHHQKQQTSPLDNFESLGVIGRGAFGEVRLVRRKGHSSSKEEDVSEQQPRIFALKSMKTEHHLKTEERLQRRTQNHNNPWLVKLYDSFEDQTHSYMVMEFVCGGDLMNLLKKNNTFSESTTRFIVAELSLAVSSIHALKYIHCDLKPDNVLITARGHLKLTDLGLCKRVGGGEDCLPNNVILQTICRGAAPRGGDESQQHTRNDSLWSMSSMSTDGGRSSSVDYSTHHDEPFSLVGTVDYLAPEVVLAAKQQTAATNYSPYTCAVDWWSLGVIMYECLVGYTPFSSEDSETTCDKILRWRQTLEIPADKRSQLSEECVDFLSCLLAGPDSRIEGISQVVRHPWFKGFDWGRIHQFEGPLLPAGAHEFPELLKYLGTCDTNHPKFRHLVKRVTRNFDTFEDSESVLEDYSSPVKSLQVDPSAQAILEKSPTAVTAILPYHVQVDENGSFEVVDDTLVYGPCEVIGDSCEVIGSHQDPSSCPCCNQKVGERETLGGPNSIPCLHNTNMPSMLDDAADEEEEDVLPGVLSTGTVYHPKKILAEGWLYKKGTGTDWMHSRGFKPRWARLLMARVGGYDVEVPLLSMYWYPSGVKTPSTVIVLDSCVVVPREKEDKARWNAYRFDVIHVRQSNNGDDVTRTFSAPKKDRDAWVFAINEALLRYEKEKAKAKKATASPTRRVGQQRTTQGRARPPTSPPVRRGSIPRDHPPHLPPSHRRAFSA